jgi:L,D-peptidoglycan transpeptidase YkuD (ErfK/YbiS/YcfS/YnhG family)
LADKTKFGLHAVTAAPREGDLRVRASLSRRAALGAALAVLVGPKAPLAAETQGVAIEYRGGRLYWPGDSTRAAVGKSGVTLHKKEGDGATPVGNFGLPFGMYRPDRVKAPTTALPLKALRESHAWVDDPKDVRYNSLIELPYPAHVEKLWRSDEVYDVLIVVDYNMNPTAPGAGSAIFLHIARPRFTPTLGCVAVERTALLRLLEKLGPQSTLTIRA